MSKCIGEPATICLALGNLCDPDVFDVVHALVSINARAYESGALPAPWSIRWVPDSYGRRASMRDVRMLQARGHGSCHEVAAAYAGWLRAMGDPDADVEVIDAGPVDFHVVAVSRGRTYDPQVIGAE